MLDNLLQYETRSIVFLGDFNPVIMQPFWLGQKKLIRESEAQNADVEIIHNEIVKYKLDWVELEVTANRFLLKTSKEPYFEPMKDLAIGVFKILADSNIRALGINNIYDLSLRDDKQYFEFGKALTPLHFWEDGLKDPRLMQLEIMEKERLDGIEGSRTIRIMPSSNQTIQFGVAIDCNSHFPTNQKSGTSKAIQIVEKYWDKTSQETRDNVSSFLTKLL